MPKITAPEQEVKMLEKEVVPFIKKAQDIKIFNTESMTLASEMLSSVNKYADEVKKKKETITKPLNAALKAARAVFAPLEDRLDETILKIRNAMIEYQTIERKKADNETAKIAARVGEGKGKLTVDTAVRKIEEIDRPENKIATESGSVKFKTVKKFEVMDVTLLPIEYILPDEVKIRQAMLAGMELTGVRYYTEEIPVNTR